MTVMSESGTNQRGLAGDIIAAVRCDLENLQRPPCARSGDDNAIYFRIGAGEVVVLAVHGR